MTQCNHKRHFGVFPLLAVTCAVAIAHVGFGSQNTHSPNSDSEKTIYPHSLSDEQRLYFTRRLGLEEIPANQGGGYLCYTRFGNGRDADIARLASVPGVRAFILMVSSVLRDGATLGKWSTLSTWNARAVETPFRMMTSNA